MLPMQLGPAQQYGFRGDPVSQALAVKAHQVDRQAQGQLAAAQAQTEAARAQAQGGFLTGLYSQPAAMADALTKAYGGYAQGLGNVAGAQSNEASARYGANTMAEAARQAAAGNIGAASLGAYGGAANNAMQAWAANQSAYNKAASDMHAANQNALATYGVGRNSSLASLGGFGTIGNFNFGGGGGAGGFSATGVNGPIASGSYGGGGFGPGGGFVQTGQSQSFLDTLRRDILSQDTAIPQQATAGRDQIDSAYYSNREAPQQMLDQALAGLSRLGGQGYRAGAQGMDQYYASANDPAMRTNYSGILDALRSGYSDTMNRASGVMDMYRPTMSLWEQSLLGSNLPGQPQPQSAVPPNITTAAAYDAYMRGRG